MHLLCTFVGGATDPSTAAKGLRFSSPALHALGFLKAETRILISEMAMCLCLFWSCCSPFLSPPQHQDASYVQWDPETVLLCILFTRTHMKSGEANNSCSFFLFCFFFFKHAETEEN